MEAIKSKALGIHQSICRLIKKKSVGETIRTILVNVYKPIAVYKSVSYS